jgi:excinuclease ABC subunit A
MRINDELVDISEAVELDEALDYELDVVIDTVIVKPEIFKNLVVSIETGLRVGEGFLRWRILKNPTPSPSPKGRGAEDWFNSFSCPQHHCTFGETEPWYFSFNEPDSWCRTCLGLGTYLRVHPDLIVPDKSRSILAGALVPEAFRWDKNNWRTQIFYSVATKYGIDLDVPFSDLPAWAIDIIFSGTKGEKVPIVLPEGATVGCEREGRMFSFDGFINDIERHYRKHRKDGMANHWLDEWLKKVMVEHTCPDCNGQKFLRQRLMVSLPSPHGRGAGGEGGAGKTITELGDMSLSELKSFLGNLPALSRKRAAGENIAREVIARIDLLLDIGLDYMSLNRRATTLSGGESQRIRLSVQIGSELQGMLYVLDEPSIGLHPRDNAKMIKTLQHLRDIGNSVIVVEHDESTIRAADHIIEIGPGPGVHGGEVVAQGTPAAILKNNRSLTGLFLSGKRAIAMPALRRGLNGTWLTVRGARQNNLKNIDVAIPLGRLVCITGVSGSGKSTLVNEILHKKLYSLLHDSRVMAGAHDALEGIVHVHDVINIDQTPIGRTLTSNPATYIGLYDSIRHLFAGVAESVKRGYTPARFSFNAKGGRCEECQGHGIIITSLQFLPDVEAVCLSCKGARYNAETLEITYRGKNIGDVLEMSVEDAAEFFKDVPLVAHKLKVMNQLGLGYLKLGQSSTTISGGEAQRIKLAYELSKVKRGGANLYILDEPTTGLHFADIQRLLDSLNLLVDAGNSVLVIEHHLDVIKTADWVIDLGPEGGKNGGTIVAQGTPEDIAGCEHSYTGQHLRHVLTSHAQLAA